MLALDAVVELEGAGAEGVEGAAAGAAVELEPVVSEATGVLVLSVPEGAGFSDVSLPAPGFILSE